MFTIKSRIIVNFIVLSSGMELEFSKLVIISKKVFCFIVSIGNIL